MKKLNWKKLYKEAPEAVAGERYTGKFIHVVPTRWKHDSGYRMFETYLVALKGCGEERMPEVVRLYSGNDVICFEGAARWTGPSVPLRMDMRMDGVMQFWAEEANLSVEVFGWANCDVRVEPCAKF